MGTAIGNVGEGQLQRRAAQIRAESEARAQANRKPGSPDAPQNDGTAVAQTRTDAAGKLQPGGASRDGSADAPQRASDPNEHAGSNDGAGDDGGSPHAQSQHGESPNIERERKRSPHAELEHEAAHAEDMDAGPVGGGEHVAGQGDCISSIAKNTGHYWKTLWDDSANAELRAARHDPNVLLPGDRVHVPPLRKKYEPGETEMRHRFVRKGWPEVLRVRVLRDDEPRANEPYTLTVDGHETTGFTDGGGNVVAAIEPNARRAVLQVGAEPDVQAFNLNLGGIDPISETSGIQARLNNLGFDAGPVDGKWGPLTERAVKKYQSVRGLEETGKPDEPTRRKLQDEYGC